MFEIICVQTHRSSNCKTKGMKKIFMLDESIENRVTEIFHSSDTMLLPLAQSIPTAQHLAKYRHLPTNLSRLGTWELFRVNLDHLLPVCVVS